MDPMKNSPYLHSIFDAIIDFELEDSNFFFIGLGRVKGIPYLKGKGSICL
jgi:hypothetical protein